MTLSRSCVPMILATFTVVGCASPPVHLGNKADEQQLRLFEPIPDKASVYVCRENKETALLQKSHLVMLDEKPLAALRKNSFLHTVVDPGTHGVRAQARYAGVLNVEANAGAVVIIWMGVTGGGFGALTVDFFESEQEARSCVLGADYVVGDAVD